MYKKYIFHIFIILFLIVFLGFIFGGTPLGAQTTNNTASSTVFTGQLQIDEIRAKLKEVIKEITRILVERLIATQNQAAPASNTSASNSSSQSSRNSNSSSVGSNQPFGGLTGQPVRCTCTGDYSLIPITPPKPDLPRYIMYSPSKATTYEFDQIPKAGVQLLGTHGSDVVCKVQGGHHCNTVGVGKDVIMVGTSGGIITSSGDDSGGEPLPKATTTLPIIPSNNKCTGNLAQDWTFNPGIIDQIGDASASLTNMLTCMCGKLRDQNLGKSLITSISDSKYVGNLKVCNSPSTYPGQCPASGGVCCAHGQGACHYGGTRNDNKSYAVDIGMANSGAVKAAASACGAGYVLDEGNHIHSQTGDCTPNH